MRAKLKTFGIPIAIILLLIGALFFHQLLNVKQQPDPEWSRSIPLGYSTDERPLVFYNQEGLFLASNGKVDQYSFDDSLNPTKEGTLKTSVTRGQPFWTDGDKVIQVKDGQIISSDATGVKAIDDEVTGMGTSANTIYYWKQEVLYSLSPDDLSSKEIYRFTDEVLEAYAGNDGSTVLQVRQDDTHSHLYYMDEGLQVVKNPFAIVNTATNQHINGLSFTNENNQLTLLYNEEMRAQGTLSYKILKLETSIDDLGTSILKPAKIEFTNEQSGFKLESPRSVQFGDIDGNPSILFTSESHQVGGQNTISLYIAPFSDSNQLMAKPVSTSKHFTYSPIQLSDKSIAWLDYGGDYYELFGASQDKQAIAKSTTWSKRSVKEALNNSVLMLFSSLVTILVSFYWILPSLFVLILLYMFKPNMFEKEEINWVEYASIILFILMPLTFISKAMGDYFYFAAPGYLTFSGSEYVLLVIISILSALLWKVGRDPDWGTFGGVFYFMGIYILLYVTSIGPYIFNLF
ncbi:hypothetical protein [Rossellomorea vietnamensis]|uniref:Uncharacterized protein n=1 Tax=Rossellomorea vietnamensis TaxID=218284 RepID=A0A0P6WJX4_9BACI|nr:hypothetical protein [Rossellomorea vietnamensis]KPL57912.1 hypothetical protein AM506_19510 [Rossellomorea vietnamensis]